MAIDFSKFDKMVDVEGLKEDLRNAEANGGGDYVEVPKGTYEVKVASMELGETGENSKNPGSPMVKIRFKVLSGEYKGQSIFMNQVVTQGFQIHLVDEFLRSLDSGVEIVFESFSQYAQMLMDVAEAIDGKLEYALEYGEKKGFNTFKITEIFEVE